MNFPKNPLFLFIQRIFLVLLLYTVVRLGFYFYNQSFFPEINADVFMGGLKQNVLKIIKLVVFM